MSPMQVPFSDLSKVDILNTSEQVIPQLDAQGNFSLPLPVAQLGDVALLPLRVTATAAVQFRPLEGGAVMCRPILDAGNPGQPTGQALWVQTRFVLFSRGEGGMAGYSGHFIYRFPSTALAQRLKTLVDQQFGTELTPLSLEGHHVRPGTGTAPPAVELVDRAQQLELWWSGSTETPMQLSSAGATALAVALQPGEHVELAFALRKLDPRSSEGSSLSYRVNLGFVAERLSAAALLDPAAAARLSGRTLDGGGNVVRLGTTKLIALGLPNGYVPVGGGDPAVLIVWGGSKDPVVINPYPNLFGKDTRLNVITPAALFSYTPAEAVHVASPAFGTVAALIYTLDPRVNLDAMRETLAGRPGTVPPRFTPMENTVLPAASLSFSGFAVPAAATGTILATEFRDTFKQVKVPRAHSFYEFIERHVVYSHEFTLPHPVTATATSHHELLPNREVLLRPWHPPFKGEQKAQLRRSFPIVLKLRLGTAQDAPYVLLGQDEIDVIRQEYMLHMNWEKDGAEYYYQNADYKAGRDSPSNAPIMTGPANNRKPRVGGIGIPARADFREHGVHEYDPIDADAQPHYLSTPAPLGWDSTFTNTIVPRYNQYRDSVVHVLTAQPGAPPVALDPVGPRFIAFVQNPAGVSAGNPVLEFIAQLAAIQQAAARIADARNDNLMVSSFWRPPEHNETVSQTRASPHQASRGFDIQPVGVHVSGTPSPLNMLALHMAAEKLLPTSGLFSQVILERGPTVAVMFGFDDALADRAVVLNGTKFELTTGAGQTFDLSAYYAQCIEPEETVGLLSRNIPTADVATMFQTEYVAYRQSIGVSTNWPNPTVEELYYYALIIASHVHFTAT